MKCTQTIYQTPPCLNHCLSPSNYENKNYNEKSPQVNISSNINSLPNQEASPKVTENIEK